MANNQSDTVTDRVTRESVFHSALSGTPVHNAFNQAYHFAKLHDLVPHRALEWKVPAFAVPLKVRRSLDAEAVVAKIKKELVKARAIIQESRSFLDQETKKIIHHSPDSPYDPLHENVKVTRHVVEGYAPRWAYEFNPYSLSLKLLDEYEQLIDTVMKSRLVPFTKLSRIYEKARFQRYSSRLVDFIIG